MALPFIEIIESITPEPQLLMWKFPDADREIKNGAALTVRESQAALFLNEGLPADIFTPGRHTLETANIPVLSRLKGWKYGFESPIKADVYFFNTHQFLNLKWGTPAPVLLRDTEFGQVRVRAFGSYNIRISDVARFFREYAGTYPRLSIIELEWQLRDFIAPRFAEALAQANIPVIDLAGNLSLLNERIRPLVQACFTDLGLEVTQFTVTSATLPEEVLKHYDKITGMNMVGDMQKFTQFNLANAMENENSVVAGAAAAAQQAIVAGIMMNEVKTNTQPPTEDVTARLKKLKELFDMQLITDAEYTAKKEELLKLL
ncbi:SPFH domain-containing protein [Chitinophaga pendula]|uniref:SPFH domain-containing protein n=1 Tax=Chitinophaga TaxID=79328 RepID=UPI000BAFE079|nr:MULTISPECIES: SPFH domain-containing protein [Chitinophaga]ASZ12970.1 virion core protein (lumpy skin disease virus) [Chitinophaga sp. MD30]UCJ09397.1 SPFH domain-containing protein [Chitinophaga pendula]